MTVTVRFMPANIEVAVPPGTTLLEAAHAADMPVGNSCGADGICGKCGLRLLEGVLPSASEREARVSTANRVSANLRLSCMVQVQSDVVVTADYW